MGVRGLTTFIAKNSDKYFEDYELHDCSLIIDGNNLAAQLYKYVSKCNSAFGGDYDVYYNCVRDFFKALEVCKIQPYVLFDGGYETKKRKSVYSRLIAKQSAAQILCPANQSLLQIFPLMMRDVFRQVLRDLCIPFMQCDFEADDEISDIAREMSCPVLSNDSDFYIYDVEYIPFTNLDRTVYTSDAGYSYLSCKIYRIEIFLNSFGGLRKEMLPLLATLLGNDYIARSTFKNFYAHLKLQKTKKKISDQQRTIAALLQWLRNETYETAVEKILGRLKLADRPHVLKKIVNTVSGYLQGTNNASLILGIKSSPINIPKSISSDELSKAIDSKLTQYLDNLYINNHLNINTTEEEKLSADEISYIPSWFRFLYNKGTFPSYFMDLIIFETVYSNPLVEDVNYPDTNTIALPILSFIFKILKNGGDSFTYVGRNSLNHIARHKINVQNQFEDVNFPRLSILNTFYPNYDLFHSFLKDTTGEGHTEGLQALPKKLHLYIIGIYWLGMNLTEPKLLASHIHAIILCILYLQCIDPAIEKCRSLAKIKNKYEKLCTDKSPKAPQLITDCYLEYDKIPIEECYATGTNFITYFKIEEKLKSSNKLFERRTVHTFSMFQNVVQQLNILNSLLGFPVVSSKIHQLYNGTFIYNAYAHIKSRANILSYIQLLLKDAPCLFKNYNIIYMLLRDLLPNIFDEKKQKRKSKRKNKKIVVEVVESLESDCKTDEENVDTDNTNNMYWLLNNIKDK